MSETVAYKGNTKNLVQRDKTIDIMKGISIILMVMGHSGVPFKNFIYLFHMAIFFMISGYLWNDKYVKDVKSIKQFIKKRVLSLYVPFIFCNGLFVIFHNILVDFYFVSGCTFTFKEKIFELIKLFCLSGVTTLGGATWFLKALFIISIFHLLFRCLTTRLKHGSALYLFVVGLAGVGTALVARGKIHTPFNHLFCAYLAFNMGFCIRKYDFNKKIEKHKCLMLPLSLIILLIMNCFGSIAMNTGKVTSLCYFLLASLAGWVLLTSIAEFIKNTTADILVYIGCHSLFIVLWHFLALKIVSLIFLCVNDMEMELMAKNHILSDIKFLWIPYTIVGVILPLLIGCCFDKWIDIKEKIGRRLFH